MIVRQDTLDFIEANKSSLEIGKQFSSWYFDVFSKDYLRQNGEYPVHTKEQAVQLWIDAGKPSVQLEARAKEEGVLL